MASAGWDEVLGGAADDGGDPPDHGDGDGEDEAPEKQKRIKTSTKVVLVAAGWVLLTLFLIGQFSADKAQPSAVARLDTVSGEDGATDETLEEEFEPEPVDTEEEEALDVDGDGFLSAEEQGIVEGEAAASLDGGGSSSSGEGASGSTGGGTGSGSGSTSGGESGGGGNAVPGAAPATTTTARTGAGGGATTTTTAGGGGGGGGGGTTSTTATTKPGGGGTTTTTTASTTTTSTATSTPSGLHLLVKAVAEKRYEFPSPHTKDLSLPVGSTITFDNNEDDRRHSFTIRRSVTTLLVWDSGELAAGDDPEPSPPLQAGTYTFACTNHPNSMNGTIAVQ